MLTRCAVTRLPTTFGEFQLVAYRDHGRDNGAGTRAGNGDGHAAATGPHLALVKGVLAGHPAPLVRIHSECLTGEVFGSRRCDCRLQLETAMQEIEREGAGVVVYLRQEGRGIGLVNKLHAYSLQDGGLDTVDANLHLGLDADLRDYRPAIEILLELGVQSVRLLTNNPAKLAALERSPIRLHERVPLRVASSDHNRGYLETKRRRLGHLLDGIEGP